MPSKRQTFGRERLEQAAGGLSPAELDVLLLSARNRLTSEQIASRLGIKARRAERLLSRALRKLDRALERQERARSNFP
jgi:RNA polymerase sigma factor (sigma-70 family)